jgi:NAD(P)-dependent dehydrogenase (short-subunit alcohol dehydrogenase family)
VSARDRVVLVTGATSGIGQAAAVLLARAGWSVVVHGRSRATAAAACRRIAELVPGARLWCEHADLASLAQVRALADRVAGRRRWLAGLVANAGLFTPNALQGTRLVSEDGYELMWAVNYLATFALATRLAPRTGTLVAVSSGMVGHAGVHWDDPQLERGWDRVTAYGQSKLALTMFTIELAARAEHGQPQTCAVNPGYIDTRLVREAFGGPAAPVTEGARWVVQPLLDDRPGAGTAHCLDQGVPVEPPLLATDPTARARLWTLSQRQLDRADADATGGRGSAQRASQQGDL